MAPAHYYSEGSESKEVSGLEVKTLSSWSRCKMSDWSVESWNHKFMDVSDICKMGSTAKCTVLSAVMESDVLSSDLESGQIT